MPYLPVFIELQGRDCLVLGGGHLAESRVDALCEAGAAVTVVAPEVTPRLEAMARAGTIKWIPRIYAPPDMRGRFMAWIAISPGGAIALSAAADARKLGVLINVADRPALCDFITPAVVKRGDVQVAISTGGASPALARRIRQQVEQVVGPEYGAAAELLRSARRWLRGRVSDSSERARMLSGLMASGLVDAVRHSDSVAVEKLLRTHLGAGFEDLGVDAAATIASGTSSASPDEPGRA
ncbi:MAG TPA: bifunctional precorrin-2 dehydrogenase/sirohydrochlorin ferrochelatase [Candidatus Binataceae bacterium]|nr:bifunctional precorrin-2 dehydrogenase/sirohydrochlorin ferrochelatase [Candidatus Binataceae bacterium]